MPKNIRVEELNLTRDFSTRPGNVYKSAASLVGWYKFEDEPVLESGNTLVYDYATNNNHGVYHGAFGFTNFPNFRAQGGTISSGGLLAHGEGYIELPSVNTLNIQASSFSVAFWFKPVGNEIHTIFSIDDPNDLHRRLSIQYSPASPKISIELESPIDPTISAEIISAVTAVPSSGVHASYTYNTNTHEHALYVDDVKIGTYVQELTLASGNTFSLLKPPASAEYGIMELGSSAIWSACLTDTEIFALYDGYIGTKGISGFLNPPVRVIQSEYDCTPLSYPSIARSGPGGLTGSEQSHPYDDSKTITFDSAYASAWIRFNGRPKDASTITLFDPAGDISLLPATATTKMTLDDLTVDTNSELVAEQVYEVEIVESSSWPAPSSTGTFPDEDMPVVSGQWTGISHQDYATELPYNLIIHVETVGIPHINSPGSTDTGGGVDGDDPILGTFSVELQENGSTDSLDNLIFDMPSTGDAEYITACNLSSTSPVTSIGEHTEKKLEGIKITWPNPWNHDSGTEGTDGEITYDFSTTFDDLEVTYTNIPKPDKFRWRKANLEDYKHTNNWTGWQPEDDGTYIGTGNAKRSYTVLNAKYSNTDEGGYVYSDIIDLSQVDAVTGEIPTEFDVRVYARGDISRSGADPNSTDEYYEVYYSLNPEDPSPDWHWFNGDPESGPIPTLAALYTVNEHRPSQRKKADETDTGAYEYDVTDGRWNGLSAYAPFADGHKFTEKELTHVAEDTPGNQYEFMPDDPHIAANSIVTSSATSLQFKVKPGTKVSWGTCQVKFVVHYTGTFWYFDDIDNDDASGNNIKLKWGSFTGHTVGDKWVVNVEDTTNETFEFNRGKIVNPVNTEIKIPRRPRTRRSRIKPRPRIRRVAIGPGSALGHRLAKGPLAKTRTKPRLTDIERDQINGIFAKAINDAGLQIEAHHDGDKVLLRQTVPGKVGNLEIHADKKAFAHISNSVNFTPGAKGELTGSFAGGDNYLVSYPTTLPAPVQKSVEDVLFWANKPAENFADDDYNIISTADINLLLDLDGKKLYADESDPEVIVTSYDPDPGATPGTRWDPPGWEDTGGGSWVRRNYYSPVDSVGVASAPAVVGEYWVDDHKSDGTGTTTCILKRYGVSSNWETEDIFMATAGTDVYRPIVVADPTWNEESWREYHNFTLPAYVESPWLNSRIMQPNYQTDDYARDMTDCGLIATGSTKKGVADIGIRFSEDQSVFSKGPYVDDQIDIDVDNEFFEQGLSPDIYEGFSSPLRSKTQFTIELPVDTSTAFGYHESNQKEDTENPNMSKRYNSMVYYNFASKAWESVGPGHHVKELRTALSWTGALAQGYITQAQWDKFVLENGSGAADVPESWGTLKNAAYQKAYFENACIGFSRGTEIIQSASITAALPISNFGFPMHPKFHASEDQLLDMSNYIDKPFILEKFVFEYDAEWSEGTDFTKRSIMFDIGPDGKIRRYNDDEEFNNKAAINSFFILNQRDWVGNYEYNSIANPTRRWRPPHYDKNVTQHATNSAKSLYMWDGSSYDYDEADSLTAWFRFDTIASTTDSFVDADLNSDGTADNTAQITVSATVESEEDSPWNFPPGAPTSWEPATHGDYTKSAKLSDGGYMKSSLAGLAGAEGIGTPPDDPIVNPTESDAGTGALWFYNADVTPDDGMALVTFEEFTSTNQPGSWPVGYVFSNDPDGVWQSTDITKNTRFYYGDPIYGTKTVKYKLIQAVASQYPSLNEPPDTNMEGREYAGNVYAHEGLIFQIAPVPVSNPSASPDSVAHEDWINIIEHDPDYSMQGVWQDHAVTIDPSVYGIDPEVGWFVRWLQPGTSGWPDAWMITDMSAGAFSSFSKSLWFKTAVPGSRYANLLTIASNLGAPNKIWISIYKDGTLRFLVDSGQNRVYTKIKSPKVVTDSQWHHVAFAFSAETYTFQLWLDGEFVGEYVLPQLTDDDGELLWRKGDSTLSDDAAAINEAQITYADVLNAGISSLSINESYWGEWNSETEEFVWNDGVDLDPDDPAEGPLDATQLEAHAYTRPYNFNGLEKIVVGGITVTMTPAEFMAKIGFNPARPWYFESTDHVILGADIDWKDWGPDATWGTADIGEDDGASGTNELTYDNYFTGNISDFAVWSSPIDGIDAKAIYHMDSGIYKVGKHVDISLNGTNPYFFNSPLDEDFEVRDSKGEYSISDKLLARYLVDPNNFNNLLVQGPVQAPAYIQRSAEWCDDGPWQPDATISRVPDWYRYGMDFASSKFYVRLPRANEYWPTRASDVESWHNAGHSTYPDFSFFTWIKIDGDMESNDPVIFSINTKLGGNRLIFMVDTADKARMKGSTPKGYRLQLHVQANLDDVVDDTDLSLKYKTGLGSTDNADTNIGADNVTTRNWYKVITDNIRDNGTKEINDNQWHHVGFTHHVDEINGSTWNIYVDGDHQTCHLATYHKIPGAQNDIWRYVFDSGTTASGAGYNGQIWNPLRTKGWLTPQQIDIEATGGGTVPSSYWMRFQKMDGADTHTPAGSDFSDGVYSELHNDHSLEFDELDRISLGQEYDAKWLRKFKTTRRGERTYRTFRYRRASQFFEGKMADVSIWNDMLSSDDVTELYNARYGTSEGDKWFNMDHDADDNEIVRRNTARDLVTYGQWSIYGSVKESPVDIADVLETGLSREIDTVATYRSEVLNSEGVSYATPQYELLEYDGDPKTPIFVSGSYVMEGISKRPVKHTDGLAYTVGTRKGTNGYKSLYKTSHNGTRTGQVNDIASARALFNAVPGKDVTGQYYDFGSELQRFDRTNLNIFEPGPQESPYILMPNDKLVLGWQCAEVFHTKLATNRGTGPHMTLNPARMKLTLFGSYIQDGKEKQGSLNQNLTSDAIHEAIQFETPIHDKFQLEDIGYNAGAYTDDVISGSMDINEKYGERSRKRISRNRYDYGFDIARRKIASVAEHTQGSRGSMLRGVRVVDAKERYYDTMVAAPSDYHALNGNGVLVWSSPWFNEGKTQRSLCFGEPRPSDMKVVVPEKTIIRCREEGWYEPLPQGVIKLTFSRLWTADYRYGNSSLPYYVHETGDSSPSYDYAKTHSVPWYIKSEAKDQPDWYYDGDIVALEWSDTTDGSHTHTGRRYTYTPYAAGTNYMFKTYSEELSGVADEDMFTSYFSIYDANSDVHIIHLNWGGADPPEVSSDIDIINVPVDGWATNDNDWEDGDGLGTAYATKLADTADEIKDAYSPAITGLTPAEVTTLYPDGFLQPTGTAMLSAENFAERVGEAIDASPMFEVLKNDSAYAWQDFPDNSTAEAIATYSIYIRTIDGGLDAADPAGTSGSSTGGGIPGIHYQSPDIDVSQLYSSYYKYIGITGAPIVGYKYTPSSLKLEGPLVYHGWGMVQEIDTARVTFTEADGATTGDGTFADASTSLVASSVNTAGYDIDGIASDINLSATTTGVSTYIQNLRPNNLDQFRRQLPVMETKDGFERIIDYTLDGCFMQIHDAKDNAYNLWYKLDDSNSVAPQPPTTSGILVSIDKVSPGAPPSSIAYETATQLSASHSDRFEVTYNEGDEFFTILNTRDGSTKDADSTIMGLPTTTGFYLTDEDGDEYDNQSYVWNWNGGHGFFSFAITTKDAETYAVGKTPEDPAGEHYLHGDPIQEGVDPYHVNTNSTIDAYWLGSYPFEPKYASLRRGNWRRDNKTWNVTTWDDESGEFDETTRDTNAFYSIIITGSNLTSVINDPTLEASGTTEGMSYPVMTIVGDGSPQPQGTSLRLSTKTNENFLKFYFGCGDTWQKNPELEIVMIYSDGYDWPSAVPKIRGWKYGLKSALPENTSAVYRHNSYGQFRDLLEQRKDSRFFKTSSKSKRFPGRGRPSSAPVRCRFVSQDGTLTTPEKTWSQNLSRFCTSSLPYFDDGEARNREHPMNEEDLNTSFGLIKD